MNFWRGDPVAFYWDVLRRGGFFICGLCWLLNRVWNGCPEEHNSEQQYNYFHTMPPCLLIWLGHRPKYTGVLLGFLAPLESTLSSAFSFSLYSHTRELQVNTDNCTLQSSSFSVGPPHKSPPCPYLSRDVLLSVSALLVWNCLPVLFSRCYFNSQFECLVERNEDLLNKCRRRRSSSC